MWFKDWSYGNIQLAKTLDFFFLMKPNHLSCLYIPLNTLELPVILPLSTWHGTIFLVRVLWQDPEVYLSMANSQVLG